MSEINPADMRASFQWATLFLFRDAVQATIDLWWASTEAERADKLAHLAKALEILSAMPVEP